jgi:hypothetical protein
VAGLLQTFRDPAPPSIVGQLDGADLQTANGLWEGRFRDTYLSLGGEWLEAERNRRLGLFLSDPFFDPPPTLGLIKQEVRFREYALDMSAHQLVGREWSFGARYRLAHAELKQRFPEYPGIAFAGLHDKLETHGWLHTVSLTALYRHSSGLFAQAEGHWFSQARETNTVALTGDSFWQANLIAGYRFPQQKAELAVGLLNVFDKDYRLDPINQYAERPRARTFYARLLLNF